MEVLRQGETWPEFSEFAIISTKIRENKSESCDIMRKVGDQWWRYFEIS